MEKGEGDLGRTHLKKKPKYRKSGVFTLMYSIDFDELSEF